jgi:hypothetical protein
MRKGVATASVAGIRRRKECRDVADNETPQLVLADADARWRETGPATGAGRK